jgi:hypothetical protein
MMVNGQTINNLTASAGLQVRCPFVLNGARCDPFINVTTTQVMSHRFRCSLTPAPNDRGTYDKIATGVAARIIGTPQRQRNRGGNPRARWWQ